MGDPRPLRPDHRADDQPRWNSGLGGQRAHRPAAPPDRQLAAYLFREDDFPEGAVLSTGTSLVPDLPFTLRAGDKVSITISGIGVLTNPVVRGKAAAAAGKGAN